MRAGAPRADDLLRHKHFLRRHYRALAAARPPAARRAAGESAARRLRGLPVYRRARTVGLYLSLPHEIPTGPLITACRRDGKRVAVPVAEPIGWRLGFVELPSRGAALGLDVFGAPRPRAGEAVGLGPRDLLVVPGAAFTAGGRRLGSGGGFYDRFLAEARGVPTVGLAFDEQVAVHLPSARHDRPVDAVVTPSAVFPR